MFNITVKKTFKFKINEFDNCLRSDPVDCDIDDPCELAWIFRDNLRLDLLVDIGKCPEGTLFYELDRNICPTAANVIRASFCYVSIRR